MARFIQIEKSGVSTGIDKYWINIDMIVSMYYDKDKNYTYIFSADSPDDYFTLKGDYTNQILNANNDITMHDKLIVTKLSDKFKSILASILARLDSISKNMERIQKRIE